MQILAFALPIEFVEHFQQGRRRLSQYHLVPRQLSVSTRLRLNDADHFETDETQELSAINYFPGVGGPQKPLLEIDPVKYYSYPTPQTCPTKSLLAPKRTWLSSPTTPSCRRNRYLAPRRTRIRSDIASACLVSRASRWILPRCRARLPWRSKCKVFALPKSFALLFLLRDACNT